MRRRIRTSAATIMRANQKMREQTQMESIMRQANNGREIVLSFGSRGRKRTTVVPAKRLRASSITSIK